MTQHKDLKYFLSNNFKDRYDTTKETFFINENFSEVDVNNPHNREKILFSTSIDLMYQNIRENVKYEYFLKAFDGKKNYSDVIIFNDMAVENKKIENIFENKIYSNTNFKENFENDCKQIKRYLKELKEHSLIPEKEDFLATLIYYKPEVYFNNPSNFSNYLDSSYKINNISEIDDVINKTGFFIITWKINYKKIIGEDDCLSKEEPTSYTIPFIVKFTNCYLSYVDEEEDIFNARLRTPINQLNKLPFYNNEGDVDIANVRDLMNINDKDMINERINIFITFLKIFKKYKSSSTQTSKLECLNIDPDPRNLQLKISKTIIRKHKSEGKLFDLTINSCNCNVTDGQHSSMNYYKIYDDVSKAINSKTGYFETNSIYDKAIKSEFKSENKNNLSIINLKEFKEIVLDKLTVDINIRGIEDADNAKRNTEIKNTRREVSNKHKLERKHSHKLNFIANTYNISEQNINNNIIQFNKSHHSNPLLLKKEEEKVIPISYFYYIDYFSDELNINYKEKMLKDLENNKVKIVQTKEIWEKNFEDDFSNKEFVENEFLIQHFTQIKKIPENQNNAIEIFIDSVLIKEETIKPKTLLKKIQDEIDDGKETNNYDKKAWIKIQDEIEKNTQMDGVIKGKLLMTVENINDFLTQGQNIDILIKNIEKIDTNKTIVKIETLNIYFEFFSFLISHYKNNINKRFSFDEESYIKLVINIMKYNQLPINKLTLEKIINNIDLELDLTINNSILELRNAYDIKILRSNYKDNNENTRIDLLKELYKINEDKDILELQKQYKNDISNNEKCLKEKINNEIQSLINDLMFSDFKIIEKNSKVYINENQKNISFIRQINVSTNKGDLERLAVSNKINILEYIKDNYNFTVYTIEHGNSLVKTICQNVHLVEQGIKSQTAKSYSIIEI